MEPSMACKKNRQQDIAKDTERFGNKLNMVLYVDPQAEEKKVTAQTREVMLEKALEKAKDHLGASESRVDSALRISKQHFIAINKKFAHHPTGIYQVGGILRNLIKTIELSQNQPITASLRVLDTGQDP
ncbi:hypothetical protein FBU30_008175 [Linnemannia zychae]|nr:hypothetical protein FBU30_008175 [Linnemannia zychae]